MDADCCTHFAFVDVGGGGGGVGKRFLCVGLLQSCSNHKNIHRTKQIVKKN